MNHSRIIQLIIILIFLISTLLGLFVGFKEFFFRLSNDTVVAGKINYIFEPNGTGDHYLYRAEYIVDGIKYQCSATPQKKDYNMGDNVNILINEDNPAQSYFEDSFPLIKKLGLIIPIVIAFFLIKGLIFVVKNINTI